MANHPPALLSRREAATRLQVHDSSITHFVQRGLLTVVERRPPQGQQFFRWAEGEALAQARQRVNGNGHGHHAATPLALQVPADPSAGAELARPCLPTGRPDLAALVLQVHAAQGKLLEALAGPIPSSEALDELWMLLLQHSRSLTRILEEVLLELPVGPE